MQRPILTCKVQSGQSFTDGVQDTEHSTISKSVKLHSLC